MLEVDSEQTRFVGMAQPPVMVDSSRSDSDRTPLPPIRAAEWQGKKPTRTKALPPTMRKARWQHFKHAKLAAFLAEASVFFSRWLLMRQRRIGWSDALALSRICGIYWWYFRFIFESSANPSCGSATLGTVRRTKGQNSSSRLGVVMAIQLNSRGPCRDLGADHPCQGLQPVPRLSKGWTTVDGGPWGRPAPGGPGGPQTFQWIIF
jgi:hypothetical protein